MSATLSDYRLVFVGPRLGQTAVGDYAEDIVTAVRPYFREVLQVRTGGPGSDTLSDVRRHRAAVARHVAGAPAGRVLVHAELSTASLSPFWATTGLRGVPVTATVHDPPQGVWMPLRTRFVGGSRLLNHGIHYPARPLSRKLEGAVYRGRTLFALTETGRRSIARVYPDTDTRYIPHVVRDRPDIRPAHERPRAVGFFGHVYRGKGFEQIEALRRMLPDDIGIRVAGRGTQDLPAVAGVDVLGPVDGPSEDAFFESVQAIVVPYGKRHFYAESFAASGVVAHSTAYATPQICTDYAALAELDESVGAVVVRVADGATGVTDALAGAITALLDAPDRVRALGESAARTRAQRSAVRTAEAFTDAWSEILDRRG